MVQNNWGKVLSIEFDSNYRGVMKFVAAGH